MMGPGFADDIANQAIKFVIGVVCVAAVIGGLAGLAIGLAI